MFNFWAYLSVSKLTQCLSACLLGGYAICFLILQYSMMSTAEQKKNVAGHQAKYTVAFGLVLKRDRYGETKG